MAQAALCQTRTVVAIELCGQGFWRRLAAQQHHGNAYQKIFEANRPMPGHPAKIYPAQVLRIPYPPDVRTRSQGL